MLNFFLGALAMVVFFTFAPPHIAAKPSEWLRDGIEWVKDRRSTD